MELPTKAWRDIKLVCHRQLTSPIFNPPYLVTNKISRHSLKTLYKHQLLSFSKRSLEPTVFPSFSLGHLGLIFVRSYNKLSNFFFQKKYLIKKKFFSFLRPNESKVSLLFTHKKFYIFKFTQSHNLNLTKFNTSEYHLYNQVSFNFFKVCFALTTLFSRGDQPLNTKYSNPSTKYVSPQYAPHLTDIRVPRIRFKPGYQKLWRQYRAALKESLGVKFLYQQQLTKYLVKFFRKTTVYAFSQNEFTLSRILISSKLLPDLYSVRLFIEYQFVYVNGICRNSEGLFMFPEDFIQLEISNAHYIFFKWLLNWSTTQEKKFKKLAFQKSLPSRHVLSKTKKQRSQYTPH